MFAKETLSSGLDFRVYAPSARVENTAYALQQGAQILQFYEEMFDYPFPLPKSDMAAIPDYAGINSFLKRFAYQNAITAQLWEELTKAWQESGVENGDVGEIMGTWTEQMGYPVITVSRSADELVITQQRFLQDPTAVSDPADSPHGYRWHVPVSFFSSEAPNVSSITWFYKQNDSVTISVPSGATWFKLNYQQQGYYRVNYDQDTWTSMIQVCLDKVRKPQYSALTK
ncbi:Peptidase M1 membrane alanine aminopeptidase N-terminal [Trinorchestia longiramus]|nr:Peptidase M1 membrane alanine aminopeptidase N-terminal [Trinorchestia longiramus]